MQHYGRRRLGWYAFARALKPEAIVETGVEKGLGACVLTKALTENAKEGHPGRYFGTDIDTNAGYLFRPPNTDVGEILYGGFLFFAERPRDHWYPGAGIGIAFRKQPTAVGGNKRQSRCTRRAAIRATGGDAAAIDMKSRCLAETVSDARISRAPVRAASK